MPQCRERRKPRRGARGEGVETAGDGGSKRSEPGPEAAGPVEAPAPTKAAARDLRRALALRENLRRRKQRQRLRAGRGDRDGGAG